MLGMGYATEALHLPGISKRFSFLVAKILVYLIPIYKTMLLLVAVLDILVVYVLCVVLNVYNINLGILKICYTTTRTRDIID